MTGGNSGIGLGTAKAYAREGASVVITGRDEQTLQAAAKEIGPDTLAVKSNVSRISDIENAMQTIREKFGRIDALFVNAGGGRFMPLEQVAVRISWTPGGPSMGGTFLLIAPLKNRGNSRLPNPNPAQAARFCVPRRAPQQTFWIYYPAHQCGTSVKVPGQEQKITGPDEATFLSASIRKTQRDLFRDAILSNAG